MTNHEKRIASLEKRIVAMDAAALVYGRWAQAAIIVAEAVAEAAQIPSAALIARITEVAQRFPEAARPVGELAEITARIKTGG